MALRTFVQVSAFCVEVSVSFEILSDVALASWNKAGLGSIEQGAYFELKENLVRWERASTPCTRLQRSAVMTLWVRLYKNRKTESYCTFWDFSSPSSTPKRSFHTLPSRDGCRLRLGFLTLNPKLTLFAGC